MYETKYLNCTYYLEDSLKNNDDAEIQVIRLIAVVLAFFSILGLLMVAISILQSKKL